MLAFLPKMRRVYDAAAIRVPVRAAGTLSAPVASSAALLRCIKASSYSPPTSAPMKRHMSVHPSGMPSNLPQHLTDAASEVVSEAQFLASNHSSSVLSAMHIAGVLFADKHGKRGWENFAGDVIQRAGGDRKAVSTAFQAKISSLPVASPRMPSPPVAADAIKVLQRAEELRIQSQDTHVAVDHLFVALVEDADVANVIEKATGKTRAEISALAAPTLRKRKTSSPSADPSIGQSLLSKFGEDLVAKAEAGKLDPVIGRDEEIRRITEILCRRTKCNPVVIGDPGVGKSAVIEGLAQRICAGGGGEPLRGTRIWTLDVGALIAGAKHHGEFEERFKGVLDEVKAADGKIILFIGTYALTPWLRHALLLQ
jgi:ATP-dependent Clp protease ATP-binding subunit ClpB